MAGLVSKGRARRATLSLLAIALAASLTAFTSDAPRAAHRAAPHSGVLGYIESGDGLAALRRNLPALTGVAVDGVNLEATGARVSSVDPDAKAMLALTHRAGKQAELLLGNYSGALQDFDPDSAHRLFASAPHRRAVIAALVADTRAGWDGIHLDLESLRAVDRAGLTRFTTELRAGLPRNTTLSMAVMASTTPQGYRDEAYDLSALARRLTQIVLMGYDQHGPGWSGPGPIGGLPWVKRCLSALLASVPRTKAVLGSAGYGYTWPARGTGAQLSDAAARRAAGKSAVWDAEQGEWHGRLAGGGTLWWSDTKSIQLRRTLARNLGVSGVAVWSLGLTDRL